MIVSFKFYVMNFVEIAIEFYIHITSHVSQAFTSGTHYTSYSLLNFVFVIVCDFGLANQVWKFLELYAKCVWNLKISRELFDNFIFRKTGFKTNVFEKHFISYSCIFMHKIQCFDEFLHKLALFFNFFFFLKNFDRSNLFLDWSKLRLKFWSASIYFNRCSIGVGSIEAFLIDRTYFSINRKSYWDFFFFKF